MLPLRPRYLVLKLSAKLHFLLTSPARTFQVHSTGVLTVNIQVIVMTGWPMTKDVTGGEEAVIRWTG